VARIAFSLWLVLVAGPGFAAGLTPDRLGVIYNRDSPASIRMAAFYAARRGIPAANLIDLAVPDRRVIDRDQLNRLRRELVERLPSNVQSLLLLWSRPYAVECMSITTAFAAGYQPEFCEPGCGRTSPNPLFDSPDWLPADTVGWLPAMLLPTDDEALARSVIERGILADGTRPSGTVYLIRTDDPARGVRAREYADTRTLVMNRIHVLIESPPVHERTAGALAYFTGVERVAEIGLIDFRPGAVADHLTSTGGVLDGTSQMSALEWLRHGATASYGSVSEPCNHLGKFPSPAILLEHYLHGDTVLEAYWKSVAMPGQGLFLGEPLARPFADPR